MPKIILEDIAQTIGTDYPAPFDAPCLARRKQAIGDAGGLTQFGAHIITLPPNSWSSQRHWHSAEDELVMILDGHPTLIDDSGETPLKPGDITAHPAGDGNGHHMKNESDKDVRFLVIGTKHPEKDHVYYPDIDLDLPANGTSEREYRGKDKRRY